MTSARKVFTSRANGRLSRGPRTAAGRARTRTALRHGLNLPVPHDAALAGEVERLVREIIASTPGGLATHAHHALAGRIAETMIDLARVRLAKRPLAAALGADPRDAATLAALERLDRYERRALSRRKFAIREFAAALAGSRVAAGEGRRLPHHFGSGSQLG